MNKGIKTKKPHRYYQKIEKLFSINYQKKENLFLIKVFELYVLLIVLDVKTITDNDDK